MIYKKKYVDRLKILWKYFPEFQKEIKIPFYQTAIFVLD